MFWVVGREEWVGLTPELLFRMYILRMYTLSKYEIVYKAIAYRAYPDHRIRISYYIYIILYWYYIIGLSDIRI